MAQCGFVQLRRGILEHLESGRITSDEYAAYTIIILKADHRTGIWKGSGKALAGILHWCERKGRAILSSLARKGYLLVSRIGQATGSSYLLRISKYFPQPERHRDAAGTPPERHRDAALLQEELLQEENPRSARHPYAPQKAEGQRERIEQRNRRWDGLVANFRETYTGSTREVFEAAWNRFLGQHQDLGRWLFEQEQRTA